MKRRELIRHLERHGAELLRKGGRHSVHVHRGTGRTWTVPQHAEINEHLTRKICRDLELPMP